MMKSANVTHIKSTLTLFTAHYRHAPLQAAAILIGIILAVTLFVAVQAINLNAKRSYEKSTELLSASSKQLIIPLAGQHYLSESLYFSLRQNGLSQALAVLEGQVRDEYGRRWSIQGSELIAAITALKSKKSDNLSLFDQLPFSKILAGEPVVLMSQSQHDSIKNTRFLVLDGIKTQVIALADDWQLANRLLLDIGFAQTLLGKQGQLSYIALFDRLEHKTLWQPFIANKARWISNAKTAELDSLTQSFHLNLTAMSLLAFLVGLFIAYNGVKYSLLKRHRLLIQIKQAGITERSVFIALLLELTLLIFIGTALGFMMGIQLSALLQPNVALTLEQLYGATLLPNIWRWHWWLQALLFTLVVTHLACWQHCKFSASQALSAHSGFYQTPVKNHKNVLFLIAILLTFLSLIGLWSSQSHKLTMLWLGVFVIAIPLYLPMTLSLLANWCEKRCQSGLVHYLFAELKELISPLSLAMMALLLAVIANIAMNRLVGSFESTLTHWLAQRLHADIYLSPAQAEMANIENALKEFEQIQKLYKEYYIDDKMGNLPIRLGTKDKASLEQTLIFKSKLNHFWSGFYQGKLTAVSEPTAVKLGLALDQTIKLNSLSNRKLKVGAIFYDYGSPHGEVMIAPALWQKSGFSMQPSNLGLKISGNSHDFYHKLTKTLALHPSQIFNQAQIKSTALALFSQTFSITKKLNAVTLLVATIGLFCSCFMLFDARKAAIARLYALGVSRLKLLYLVIGQMLCLVSFTLLIALPLGALVGFILTDIVTLRAFGWSLIYLWTWSDPLVLCITSLIVAIIATLLPLWRLVSKPTVSSLQSDVL